eukprot:942969-Prymnesium_polylepis.1
MLHEPSPFAHVAGWVRLVVCGTFNVFLLPAFALWPPLESGLRRRAAAARRAVVSRAQENPEWMPWTGWGGRIDGTYYGKK